MYFRNTISDLKVLKILNGFLGNINPTTAMIQSILVVRGLERKPYAWRGEQFLSRSKMGERRKGSKSFLCYITHVTERETGAA